MKAAMRNSRSKRRAKTVIRVFLIGFLVILLGAVIVFLSRRSNRPAVVRPETKPLTKQKVDIRDVIHFVRDTGGKNILDVRAARNFSDPDGIYHLTGTNDGPDGRVRIESRGRDGQLKFGAAATEVLYDADWTRLVFQGEVEIHLDDLIVKGSSFVYQKRGEVITTNVPATFESKRFSGNCRRASYRLSDEQLFLEDGIKIIAAPWDSDPFPVIISGKSMTYAREFRTGGIRGDVKMIHGRSRGRSQDMVFAEFTDRPGFRLFEFQGDVVIDGDERPADRLAGLKAEPPKPVAVPSSDEGLIFFLGGRQHMEADTVTFVPYGNENWPHYASLRGGGRIEIFDDAGRQTTLEAGAMVFFYNEGWELQDFHLQGRARIRGEAEGRMRLVEASNINFNSQTGILAAGETGAAPARTISGGREMTAESMLINLKNDNFDMRGGVKIVSFPQSGEARDAALFDAGRPLFMTAGFAHYEADPRLFRLGDRARLWQGRESLEGDDVTIFEETGDLSVLGAVRSVFFQRPKEKDEDQRVEITGDRLNRTSKKGSVIFLGSCSLAVGEMIMKAGRLTLEPGEGKEKYRRILADQQRVIIIQEPNKAQGDRADYDLAEDVIVLTGNTVLEDNTKGIVHKDGKLTFHPADGKILIENKDAERSTTIIKS
jgi:lipopolysaccharide transport protein LptA